MPRLDDRTLLVTGATGQVGWGVARAADEAGARLVLTASRPSSVTQLADEFPDATVVEVDLAAPGSDGAGDDVVAAALQRGVAAAGGRLDHVVAPIGSWWQRGATLEESTTELEGLLATYVLAQHRLLRATAPLLGASGGSYTLVTGAGGARPIPGAGMLVVAVRGQWALAEVLRAELADAPFRFNELRIRTRVEREPRPGVVPSREAGEAFLDLLTGDVHGELVHWPG